VSKPQGGAQFFAGPMGRLGARYTFVSRGADLVFTCGMTGHDISTGRLVREESELPEALRTDGTTGMVIADMPETRIRAQTRLALDHVRQALEEAGSSIERLVRLRLFLRDMRDAGSAASIVKAVLGKNTPSTTIVEASGPGVHPDIDVVVDAIAIARAAPFVPEHVHIAGLERLLGGFPAASIVGPYVFTTPVSAADPQDGRIGGRREALTADEQRLLEPQYFNLRDEVLAVEQVLMWRNVKRILDATRVPFENIVHQNNWLAISMQQYVPVTKVRGRLFGRGDARTAATSLPISALRTPGAAYECSVLGLKTGETRKQIRLEGHGVGPYYVGAVQAGPYVFAAGEVPVHAPTGEKPRVIGRAEDLPYDLTLTNFGRVHAEYPLMAQAAHVYELVMKALRSYGCSLQDVLHQTVYLVEPAHYPALENVAALYFGTRMPPTTLAPIRGASPFREALLEIEVTALVP